MMWEGGHTCCKVESRHRHGDRSMHKQACNAGWRRRVAQVHPIDHPFKLHRATVRLTFPVRHAKAGRRFQGPGLLAPLTWPVSHPVAPSVHRCPTTRCC